MKYLIPVLMLFLSINVHAQKKKIAQAESYAEKGLYDQAESTIDKAIMKHKPDIALFLLKCTYQLKQNELNESISTLSVAMKHFPNQYILYYTRGMVYQAANMPEVAVTDLEESLKLVTKESDKVEILAIIGGIKSNYRDHEGAYADLKKAYSIDPKNVDVLNNLAMVCDYVDKKDETLSYLEQIIEINPDYFPAYINLGYKYQLLEQYDESIKNLNKAIELNPNASFAYSNRSYSLLMSGDIQGAMSDINKAIGLSPENSWAYKVKALIMIEKGSNIEGCNLLYEALNRGFEKKYGNEVNNLMQMHCGQKS